MGQGGNGSTAQGGNGSKAQGGNGSTICYVFGLLSNEGAPMRGATEGGSLAALTIGPAAAAGGQKTALIVGPHGATEGAADGLARGVMRRHRC